MEYVLLIFGTLMALNLDSPKICPMEFMKIRLMWEKWKSKPLTRSQLQEMSSEMVYSCGHQKPDGRKNDHVYFLDINGTGCRKFWLR